MTFFLTDDSAEGDPTNRHPEMGDSGTDTVSAPVYSIHELSCLDRHAQIAINCERCPECGEDLRPFREMG